MIVLGLMSVASSLDGEALRDQRLLSHVRANSRVGTMPCRPFMGACVNTAVHMYDSCGWFDADATNFFTFHYCSLQEAANIVNGLLPLLAI